MTPQLREPFLLRGRTSVLQRAVIMSLVLGALTVMAAWPVAICCVLAGSEQSFLPMSVSWSLTAALFIYGPLNVWNCRPWWLTLMTIPISGASVFLFGLWLETIAPHPEWRAWGLLLGYLGIMIVSGGMLVKRQSRVHWFAYGLSVFGGLIPAILVLYTDRLMQVPVPGVPEEVQVGFVLAAVLGSEFGILAIPWGIPFWWPPETEQRPAASG